MTLEREIPYSERILTVVGGDGAQGSKIVTAGRSLPYKEVRVCEKGDSFLDAVNLSTDLFLAVDNVLVVDLLESARDNLQPYHTIVDGASVKLPFIPLYEVLDQEGKSVASVHVGATPDTPWGGIKTWVCVVGKNSGRAKQLGIDLFLSTNSFIIEIDIRDHGKIEVDQFLTFSGVHTMLATLRELGIPLAEFDKYATLNAELYGQPMERTAGQSEKIQNELLFNQSRKDELMQVFEEQVRKLRQALQNRDTLEELIRENVRFHNNPDGFLQAMFEKAGIIGATNANLRMFHFAFRITNDQPGKLMELLGPFKDEGANLSAILSKPGKITEAEKLEGVDPDGIVDFYVGIKPKTIDPEKGRRIKESLVELGCEIRDFNGLYRQ